MFALSLNVKQFYLTHGEDPVRCCHSRSTLASPKVQHYWNLTIKLFSVISRIIVCVWGSYSIAEMQLVHYRKERGQDSRDMHQWLAVLTVYFQISLAQSWFSTRNQLKLKLFNIIRYKILYFTANRWSTKK